MKALPMVGPVLVGVLSLSHAFADAPPAGADKNAWETAPATRRSGFTAGLMSGLAFGNAAGYPNDISKLDNPAFHSATSGLGSGGTIYIGGALADWFTFGFGLTQSSFGSSRLVSRSGAFVFHIEAFPMFSRGDTLRDVAFFADFGTGTATIQRRSDDHEWSASGSLSIVGFGALWETWRLAGHVAVGPYAAWQYQESHSMARNFGEIGIRGAFYGGP